MKSIIISMFVSMLICGVLVLVFSKMTEQHAKKMGINSTYETGAE